MRAFGLRMVTTSRVVAVPSRMLTRACTFWIWMGWERRSTKRKLRDCGTTMWADGIARMASRRTGVGACCAQTPVVAANRRAMQAVVGKRVLITLVLYAAESRLP